MIPGDGFDRGLDVEWQVAADKGFAKVTSSGISSPMLPETSPLRLMHPL